MNIKVATFTVTQKLYYNNLISGLDKDLDQWVFHPLLFDLMSILLQI